MDYRIITAPEAQAPLTADGLLKATSLLYLRDALEGERYEECATLIQNAKGYGARQSEISGIIAKYLRKLDTGQGAYLKSGRRFSY